VTIDRDVLMDAREDEPAEAEAEVPDQEAHLDQMKGVQNQEGEDDPAGDQEDGDKRTHIEMFHYPFGLLLRADPEGTLAVLGGTPVHEVAHAPEGALGRHGATTNRVQEVRDGVVAAIDGAGDDSTGSRTTGGGTLATR